MHITSQLESLYALYILYNLLLLYEDKLAQKENKIIPYPHVNWLARQNKLLLPGGQCTFVKLK